MHRYFQRSEFKCKCGNCDCNVVDYELLDVLIRLRQVRGPIIISSGHRCPTHNENEEGGEFSQHLLGKAADICVRNYSPKEIFKYLDNLYPDKYGLSMYKRFVHFDVRNTRARW